MSVTWNLNFLAEIIFSTEVPNPLEVIVRLAVIEIIVIVVMGVIIVRIVQPFAMPCWVGHALSSKAQISQVGLSSRRVNVLDQRPHQQIRYHNVGEQKQDGPQRFFTTSCPAP